LARRILILITFYTCFQVVEKTLPDEKVGVVVKCEGKYKVCFKYMVINDKTHSVFFNRYRIFGANSSSL